MSSEQRSRQDILMQPDDAPEFHPLAMLFPPLDDAEFEALREDIRE